MRSFTSLHQVTVLLLIMVLSLVNGESCWDHFAVMNSARAGGNVLQSGIYAYLVGGTFKSYYVQCRSLFLGLVEEKGEQEAILTFKCGEYYKESDWNNQIDPVELQSGFMEPALTPKLTKGIHGRSFAALVDSEIFICYACRWSLDGIFDDQLFKVKVHNLEDSAQGMVKARSLGSRRRGASMVSFGGFLWFFGGLSDVEPPYAVDHVERYNVTTDLLDRDPKWRAPFGLGLCDCSTSTTHDSIILFNCLNCTSQAYVPNVLHFNVAAGGVWSLSPSILGNEIPQIGSSNAVRVGRFTASVWPNGPISPGVQMYDATMGVAFEYPVQQAFPVSHPMFLAVGSKVYMFGGSYIDTGESGDGAAKTFDGESRSDVPGGDVTLPPKSDANYFNAIRYVREVRLLPDTEVYYDASPAVLPNQTIKLKNTAECQAPTEVLALSFDPQCTRFVDLDDIVQCNDGVLEFSMKKVPTDVTKLWICRTEGICSPDTTVPCHAAIAYNGSGNAQSDCRWEGCCWTSAGKCVGTLPVKTKADVAKSYWIAVTVTPIVVQRPTPANTPAAFLDTKWFKLIIGLSAALILYFIILCLWRRGHRAGSNAGNSTLDSLFSNNSNSGFGVFGKKYQVVKRIGQGGFGTVFHAIRRADKADVAGWKDTPIAADRGRKFGDKLPQGVCDFVAAVEHFTGAKVISIGNGPEGPNIIYVKSQ